MGWTPCCCQGQIVIYGTPITRLILKRRAAMNAANGSWYDEVTQTQATNITWGQHVKTTLRNPAKILTFEGSRPLTFTTVGASWWPRDLGDGSTVEEEWASNLPAAGVDWRNPAAGGQEYAVNADYGYTVLREQYSAGMYRDMLMRCPHKDAGDPVEDWEVDITSFGLGQDFGGFAVSDTHVFTARPGPRLYRNALGIATQASFLTTAFVEGLSYHRATDRLWWHEGRLGLNTIKYIDAPSTATWSAASVNTWHSWTYNDLIGGPSPMDEFRYQYIELGIRFADVTSKVIYPLLWLDDRDSMVYGGYAQSPFSDPTDVELVVPSITGTGNGQWDLGKGLAF